MLNFLVIIRHVWEIKVMLPSLCPKLVGRLILVTWQSGVLCRSRQGAMLRHLLLLPVPSPTLLPCPWFDGLSSQPDETQPAGCHSPRLVPLQEYGPQLLLSSPLTSLFLHICFASLKMTAWSPFLSLPNSNQQKLLPPSPPKLFPILLVITADALWELSPRVALLQCFTCNSFHLWFVLLCLNKHDTKTKN